MTITTKIANRRFEEGLAVAVAPLPVCWFQGRDQKVAVGNFSEAIRGHLSAACDD